MLQRILVPLDGSPLSERAIPYARSLARASRARIILLRAVEAHATSKLPAVPPVVPGHDDTTRVTIPPATMKATGPRRDGADGR